MKKADVDYKDALVLTKKFISKRKSLIKKGAPEVVANAIVASQLAFPFSGKETMTGFEWELNARIVLNVVEAIAGFKEN